MIPFYERGGITIYCGDCLEVMPGLNPVDVVIADPPYGVGKAEWDSSFPITWISQAFKLSSRVLCIPGNSALIQAGNAFGFLYRDLVILRNLNGMTRSKVAFGNYIPVIVAGDWKWEGRPNVLEFVVDSSERIDHPSPKPIQAMQLLVSYYTKPGWVILDPFMGSGTTLIAAKNEGRCAIGIEINESYCKIAVDRLRQPSFFSIADRPAMVQPEQSALW